jgi:hypothetical protein
MHGGVMVRKGQSTESGGDSSNNVQTIDIVLT